MSKIYNYSTIFGALAVTILLYFIASVMFGISEREKPIPHATLMTIIIISLCFFRNFRRELKKSIRIIPTKQALELTICLIFVFAYHIIASERSLLDHGDGIEINAHLAIFMLSSILISPMVEEVLFREVLFRNYIENSKFQIFGLVFFSTLFALLHATDSFYLIFLLSLVLYSVRLRTNSLLVCILIHSTWNSLFIFTWIFGV
ncbi:CPBP family intramembrane glutamic endopeptidase [Alishewanella sp. SMS8]|uniref:CPBP family intramembrane glutamic endopeptidase n=1 Tax=Alishewanella sp. SMS8 TaxID=2994676 RepID=UPI00274214D6|nr:CPBP family intramembrane glutamic endopeptidase [Alishewanella sp. SMS8]MDP5458812.1 CPBP family intramembrane metalloprotease [Alishewanella sp. SMS8]